MHTPTPRRRAAPAQPTDPFSGTRHEQRLREIQHKLGDLGRKDDFNLRLRHAALLKLETILDDQVTRDANTSTTTAAGSAARR
jgi:hypothetical protein